MELFGFLALMAVVVVGILYLAKHQRAVTWWVSTPRYNQAYKAKMLRREIEDAQEELDRITETNTPIDQQ